MSNIPNVKLHPESWKQIKKGHPWIIKDQYTSSFSKSPFLRAIEKNQKVILLNDPSHPKIKARVWDNVELQASFDINTFRNQLYSRLEDSILNRKTLFESRDNMYLVFGEADFLPGLFIQKLGSVLLIQLYTEAYKDHFKILLKYFKEILIKNFPDTHWDGVFIQQRNHDKITEIKESPWGRYKLPNELTIKEFGVNYKLLVKNFYDQGIYTDMSAIRFKLSSDIKAAKSVLNLYCYTGAFSLYALSLGVEKVTSVDLSKKYLEWLEHNLGLNPELLTENHTSVAQDVPKYLQKTEEKFDFIICDPPSFSSNGKSSSSAFSQYEKLLPLCMSRLEVGGKIALFLNTHSITKNKFQKKIEDIIKNNKLKCHIIKHLGLEQDCPRRKGFPEGDYIKGFFIQKRA